MNKVDMSASAVTARLRRVSQLRRLCLSLQKAKLPPKGDTKTTEQVADASQPAPPKTK